MPCAYGHQDAYDLTSIYSLFYESGRLLYIGKTKNLTRRYKEHITTQPWKSEIAFVRIETVYCVKCAANIELRRIRQEQPPYNIVGTPKNRREPRRHRPLPPWSQRGKYVNEYPF